MQQSATIDFTLIQMSQLLSSAVGPPPKDMSDQQCFCRLERKFGMNSMTQFRGLPLWMVLLLAAGVALVGVSTLLGVVFAGIAIGIELGSATVGVLAVLGGLFLFMIPLMAGVYLWVSGSERAETEESEQSETSDNAVEALKERYIAGEIDEETFEALVVDRLDGRSETDITTQTDDLQGRSPNDEHEYEIE